MLFKKLDTLSSQLTLHYHQYHSHPSFLSGILTIISIILCFISSVYFCLELLNHQNPTAYYYYKTEEDIGHFPVNESGMFHFINIVGGKNENKSKIFQIIGIMNTFITTYDLIGNRSLINHYTYGPCKNKSEKYKLNDINYAINIMTQSSMDYCINGFYNATNKKIIKIENEEFIYPIISHGQSHPNHTHYMIVIQICQNDSILNNNECESIEYINNYLLYNQIDSVIGILNQEINVGNYTHPMMHKFYTINFSFTRGVYSEGNLNFHPLKVKTHNGFFFEHIISEYSYLFEQNEIKNLDSLSDIFTCYHFWMQNKVEIYERNYKRIQDVIANIGGVTKAIMTCAFIINIPINNYKTFHDIEKILVDNVDRKKKKMDCSLINVNDISKSNQYLTPKSSKNYDSKRVSRNNKLGISIFPSSNNSKNNPSFNNFVNSSIMQRDNSTLIASKQLKNLLYIRLNESIAKNLNTFKFFIFELTKYFKQNDKRCIYISKIKWFYRFIVSETLLFDLYLTNNVFKKAMNTFTSTRKKTDFI